MKKKAQADSEPSWTRFLASVENPTTLTELRLRQVAERKFQLQFQVYSASAELLALTLRELPETFEFERSMLEEAFAELEELLSAKDLVKLIRTFRLNPNAYPPESLLRKILQGIMEAVEAEARV